MNRRGRVRRVLSILLTAALVACGGGSSGGGGAQARPETVVNGSVVSPLPDGGGYTVFALQKDGMPVDGFTVAMDDGFLGLVGVVDGQGRPVYGALAGGGSDRNVALGGASTAAMLVYQLMAVAPLNGTAGNALLAEIEKLPEVAQLGTRIEEIVGASGYLDPDTLTDADLNLLLDAVDAAVARLGAPGGLAKGLYQEIPGEPGYEGYLTLDRFEFSQPADGAPIETALTIKNRTRLNYATTVSWYVDNGTELVQLDDFPLLGATTPDGLLTVLYNILTNPDSLIGAGTTPESTRYAFSGPTGVDTTVSVVMDPNDPVAVFANKLRLFVGAVGFIPDVTVSLGVTLSEELLQQFIADNQSRLLLEIEALGTTAAAYKELDYLMTRLGTSLAEELRKSGVAVSGKVGPTFTIFAEHIGRIVNSTLSLGRAFSLSEQLAQMATYPAVTFDYHSEPIEITDAWPHPDTHTLDIQWDMTLGDPPQSFKVAVEAFDTEPGFGPVSDKARTVYLGTGDSITPGPWSFTFADVDTTKWLRVTVLGEVADGSVVDFPVARRNQVKISPVVYRLSSIEDMHPWLKADVTFLPAIPNYGPVPKVCATGTTVPIPTAGVSPGAFEGVPLDASVSDTRAELWTTHDGPGQGPTASWDWPAGATSAQWNRLSLSYFYGSSSAPSDPWTRAPNVDVTRVAGTVTQLSGLIPVRNGPRGVEGLSFVFGADCLPMSLVTTLDGVWDGTSVTFGRSGSGGLYVASRRPIVHGVENGFSYGYFPSGSVSIKWNVVAGKVVEYWDYYESGRLYGDFVLEPSGFAVWTSYYDSGPIPGPGPVLATFRPSGSPGGYTLRTFYESGALESEVGKVLLASGVLSCEGPERIYYEEGPLQEEWTWVNNQISGDDTEYYPSGEVMRTATFVESQVEGKEQSYFKDGKLSELTTWKAGIRDGPYQTYFPADGPGGYHLQIDGQYTDGAKSGTWTIYGWDTVNLKWTWMTQVY